MRPAATRLAHAIEECVELQHELIALAGAQREAIVGADHELVERLARDAEELVVRLSGAESRRQEAAQALADELGAAATRWSVLREALGEMERRDVQSRVDRLESAVRELELANAINGQLVMHEIELVDVQVRGMGGLTGSGPRVYTSHGGAEMAPSGAPMLLNTSA